MYELISSNTIVKDFSLERVETEKSQHNQLTKVYVENALLIPNNNNNNMGPAMSTEKIYVPILFLTGTVDSDPKSSSEI